MFENERGDLCAVDAGNLEVRAAIPCRRLRQPRNVRGMEVAKRTLANAHQALPTDEILR